MNVPVEFTVSYDEVSARRAARALFMLTWGRLLPWMGVGLTTTVIVTPMLARVPGFSWLYWVLLGILLHHVLWAYLYYWRPTRRGAQALSGVSVKFSFDDREFRMSSKRGSHTLPWTAFECAFVDVQDLVLFLTKRSAIVIPKSSMPPGALDVALAHLPPR